MRRIFVTLLLMLSVVAATVTARSAQTAASNAPTALAFLQHVNTTLHYSAAMAYPTGTNVPVESLGVSGDKYTFEAIRVINGHNFGIYKEKLQQDIAGYYQSGCNCYEVPLSALGWGGYTILNDQVTVKHYVPGSAAADFASSSRLSKF